MMVVMVMLTKRVLVVVMHEIVSSRDQRLFDFVHGS